MVLIVAGCAGAADRPAPPPMRVPPDAPLLGEPNDIPPTDAAIDAPIPDAAPPRPEAFIATGLQRCGWEKCDVVVKSSKRNVTIGSGKLRGTVRNAITAGMIGHSGTTHAYSDCKVVAFSGDELAPPHETIVKNGKYTLTLPVGHYSISFDDCFHCKVRRADVQIVPGEPATANIECSGLGQ